MRSVFLIIFSLLLVALCYDLNKKMLPLDWDRHQQLSIEASAVAIVKTIARTDADAVSGIFTQLPHSTPVILMDWNNTLTSGTKCDVVIWILESSMEWVSMFSNISGYF